MGSPSCELRGQIKEWFPKEIQRKKNRMLSRIKQEMFIIIVLSLLLHLKIFHIYLSSCVPSNMEPNQHGPVLSLSLSALAPQMGAGLWAGGPPPGTVWLWLWLSTDLPYDLSSRMRITHGLCGNFKGNSNSRGDAEARITLEKSKFVRMTVGLRVQSVVRRGRLSARRRPPGPCALCHSEIHPDPYLSSCVSELCLAGHNDRLAL